MIQTIANAQARLNKPSKDHMPRPIRARARAVGVMLVENLVEKSA
jgi:hypothetical protein